MSYKVKWETTGFLKRRRVRVTHMPRKTFMHIVKLLAAEPQYAPIRKKMIDTAATMERFPMSTWLDDERGCGCVVGEYLVARQQIKEHDAKLDALARRRAAVKEYADVEDIETALGKLTHGNQLRRFGNAIDSRIHDHLWEAGTLNHQGDQETPEVIIIDD